MADSTAVQGLIQGLIQVITDNTAYCVKMGEMVEEEFPTIVWTPCAAHVIDLIIEDISKLDWVQDMVVAFEGITRFFHRKPKALAIFCTFSKLELLRPAKTRFAYMIIAMKRLIKVQDSLRQTVLSDAWKAWPGSKEPDALKVQQNAFHPEMWNLAESLMKTLQPVYNVLRLADSEGCTLGLIYEFMDKVGESLRLNQNSSPGIRPERMDNIIKIWNNRWNWFHKPIHAVGHILHPVWRNEDQCLDEELCDGWAKYLERVYSVEEVGLLEDQLCVFRGPWKSFAQPIATTRQQQLYPITWWRKYGSCMPFLSKLAFRILSQDFSSSACERNWSTFFNIHTKKRNRLSVKQLERLVYCRENLRIIEKYKSPVGGLRQSIQRDLNCFLDADRSTRRGALERILKWMAKKTWSDCASLDVFQEAWDDVILPKLLKVCNDSMEKCRELAVQVIVTAAKQVPKVDMTTALVVPVIAKRIGQLPFLEESEEIRLSCIRLFNTLIVPQCSLETLNKVSDSLFQVLCIALGDPFHEIKKAAAGVMMVIVEREVKLVDGRTESLLRALVPNISHAHSKVRISILQAVDAIMNCDVPAVLIAEYVAPSMRALAFDRAAGVRELFFTSLARWLGYEKNSNHKVDNQTSVRSQRNPEARICPLLPSLLTGVLDDSPDIGTMNLLLVEGVGEVYLYFEAKACDEVETMNTKNEVSCIAPGCEGQMSEMELDNCTDRWFDGLSLPRPFKRRPQKGCRMMVQNFFAHLASTAMKDLRDWTAQTRLGGAKMLHVLLIVAEDHAVKHLHFLIPSLCSAVGDEDASVSQQIVKAVHVLGYCVSPSSWISLMFDHLLASSASLPQVANGLVVLSGLLFGTPSGSLDSAAIEKILGRIGQLQLGCMEDPAIQRQLLAVLTNLVHASQSISGSSASDILFLLLQLQANRELREAAKEVERALSQAVACLSVEELYQQNLQNLLTAVTTNYDTWSGNLPAQSVFVIFMQKAGTVVGPYMPSLLNLFSECLQPDRDSAMRISFLQLLDELFEIPELGTCWSSLSVQVIASILVPCGVWQPGKAEAAIRHATMVALGTFLRRDLCNQVEVASILSSQQLLALLSSCLDEDYYVDIRRVSCHVMEHILRISGELMQDNERNNVKKMLEKRLDDSSDLVRLVIIPAISAFFASMPDSYGDEHVKSFVRSIILHMDDANPQIKEAIGKALEICAHKRPLILEEVLNNARNKHQSIDYCEHLLKYIKAEAMIE